MRRPRLLHTDIVDRYAFGLARLEHAGRIAAGQKCDSSAEPHRNAIRPEAADHKGLIERHQRPRLAGHREHRRRHRHGSGVSILKVDGRRRVQPDRRRQHEIRLEPGFTLLHDLKRIHQCCLATDRGGDPDGIRSLGNSARREGGLDLSVAGEALNGARVGRVVSGDQFDRGCRIEAGPRESEHHVGRVSVMIGGNPCHRQIQTLDQKSVRARCEHRISIQQNIPLASDSQRHNNLLVRSSRRFEPERVVRTSRGAAEFEIELVVVDTGGVIKLHEEWTLSGKLNAEELALSAADQVTLIGRVENKICRKRLRHSEGIIAHSSVGTVRC